MDLYQRAEESVSTINVKCIWPFLNCRLTYQNGSSNILATLCNLFYESLKTRRKVIFRVQRHSTRISQRFICPSRLATMGYKNKVCASLRDRFPVQKAVKILKSVLITCRHGSMSNVVARCAQFQPSEVCSQNIFEVVLCKREATGSALII